jgi:hypothetical protein
MPVQVLHVAAALRQLDEALEHAEAHLRVVGDAHYFRRQRLMRLNTVMMRLMFEGSRAWRVCRVLHPGARHQLAHSASHIAFMCMCTARNARFGQAQLAHRSGLAVSRLVRPPCAPRCSARRHTLRVYGSPARECRATKSRHHAASARAAQRTRSQLPSCSAVITSPSAS